MNTLNRNYILKYRYSDMKPDPLAKQYGTRSLSSVTWRWPNGHNQ